MQSWIIGCGDVGRRIARLLKPSNTIGVVRSVQSAQACKAFVTHAHCLDFDQHLPTDCFKNSDVGILYYLVPPQKQGLTDQRSQHVLAALTEQSIKPEGVILISTTGVYGDCDGAWVTEDTPTKPQTERGQRRLDMESQWLAWGKQQGVPVIILRVPGIYAFDRLPVQRLRNGTPVVSSDECGFTNRIHADDLAQVSVAAAQHGDPYEVYNVTDGTPGKISEYLQEAAKALGLPPLPEISLQQAQQTLSSGMLSYLGESRRISNQKMLNELNVELKYPDFKQGILV